MRISTRVFLAAATFCGITILTSIGTRVLLDGQRASGLMVNLAGRQRMLTQRMTKEALELANAADAAQRAAAADKLGGTALLFDDTLAALAHGGITRDAAGDPVALTAVADPDALAALEAGAERWTRFGRRSTRRSPGRTPRPRSPTPCPCSSNTTSRCSKR
ncbi:MAG: type IV pili methyl-accepting chemotaxis transducer N-terminal domain-containing protein [Planctomycetota bacterium]